MDNIMQSQAVSNTRAFPYTRRDFLKALGLGTFSLVIQGCVGKSRQIGAEGNCVRSGH